ncbi:MAG: tetratricopeptide repeat protein, partial [Gallionella sp.]|nr:tetratricopeptide repeat protein [Gallionella sp.]
MNMINWLKDLVSPPEQSAPGDGSHRPDKNIPTHPDPADKSAAYKGQGDAHMLKGDLEEAEACYRHAIALDPDYAKAHS